MIVDKNVFTAEIPATSAEASATMVGTAWTAVRIACCRNILRIDVGGDRERPARRAGDSDFVRRMSSDSWRRRVRPGVRPADTGEAGTPTDSADAAAGVAGDATGCSIGTASLAGNVEAA